MTSHAKVNVTIDVTSSVRSAVSSRSTTSTMAAEAPDAAVAGKKAKALGPLTQQKSNELMEDISLYAEQQQIKQLLGEYLCFCFCFLRCGREEHGEDRRKTWGGGGGIIKGTRA